MPSLLAFRQAIEAVIDFEQQRYYHYFPLRGSKESRQAGQNPIHCQREQVLRPVLELRREAKRFVAKAGMNLRDAHQLVDDIINACKYLQQWEAVWLAARRVWDKLTHQKTRRRQWESFRKAEQAEQALMIKCAHQEKLTEPLRLLNVCLGMDGRKLPGLNTATTATEPLSQQEADVLKCMLRHHPVRITVETLADELRRDVKSARGYLKSLQEPRRGLVTESKGKQGRALTQKGLALARHLADAETA
jgi:hypothetical protein